MGRSDGIRMKALPVKQSWANMSGEMRRRFALLIVSSRQPPIEPTGVAVAIVRVIDCRRMTGRDEVAACREILGRVRLDPDRYETGQAISVEGPLWPLPGRPAAR